MSRKMHINRLNKEELVYELTVRGIGTGSCEEMRHRLVLALQMEKSGDSLKYPKYPYSFEEDHEAVKKNLDELVQLVAQFQNERSSNEALKIQTKLSHILGRLDNMETEEGHKLKMKSELLALTLTLMEKFNEKNENLEKKRGVPTSLTLLEGHVDANTFQEGLHNASGSSALEEPNQLARNSSGISNKTIPPHKWDLTKFSGDHKGMSISAFFERVDELRLARNVSKKCLLESGIDLFSDKAYQFYKECKSRINTWEELVEEFRTEYLSANHNDVLFEELKRRTQHPTETIGIYLAVMANYFNRLRCPISEQAKLTIILKNLHPFYQDRFRDPLPRTLSELRDTCRHMEARRDVINSYVEPTSRRGHVVERDLAFVDVTEEIQSLDMAGPSSGFSKTKEIICYRCKKPGHKAIGCAMEAKLVCFKCNKEGYTVRTCPTCSKKGNGSRRS